MRGGDSLGVNGESGETWSDSGYILKVKLTGFANRLDVVYERKRAIKHKYKFLVCVVGNLELLTEIGNPK